MSCGIENIILHHLLILLLLHYYHTKYFDTFSFDHGNEQILVISWDKIN